jgi:hypothetical protein
MTRSSCISLMIAIVVATSGNTSEAFKFFSGHRNGNGQPKVGERPRCQAVLKYLQTRRDIRARKRYLKASGQEVPRIPDGAHVVLDRTLDLIDHQPTTGRSWFERAITATGVRADTLGDVAGAVTTEAMARSKPALYTPVLHQVDGAGKGAKNIARRFNLKEGGWVHAAVVEAETMTGDKLFVPVDCYSETNRRERDGFGRKWIAPGDPVSSEVQGRAKSEALGRLGALFQLPIDEHTIKLSDRADPRGLVTVEARTTVTNRLWGPYQPLDLLATTPAMQEGVRAGRIVPRVLEGHAVTERLGLFRRSSTRQSEPAAQGSLLRMQALVSTDGTDIRPKGATIEGRGFGDDKIPPPGKLTKTEMQVPGWRTLTAVGGILAASAYGIADVVVRIPSGWTQLTQLFQ